MRAHRHHEASRDRLSLRTRPRLLHGPARPDCGRPLPARLRRTAGRGSDRGIEHLGQRSVRNPVHNRAYRHVVPVLGHSRAPQLVDSQARDLVMLLTAVPGAPAKELGLDTVEWRAVHQQAGVLCAQLHEAGELGRSDRVEAEASPDAAADGAERYLARAGGRLTEDERQLIRDHAARLRRVGPVPVGYIHGDNQPRNWMVSEGVLAPIDFERARPAARVQDFVILTATQWADHPDREKAFFRGYGRSLTDAERQALRCLTALDAVNCMAWGPDNGDELVTARGRRTLDRLMREERP
ncbi:phosphotransferase [Streptomyces goshikiensis]